MVDPSGSRTFKYEPSLERIFTSGVDKLLCHPERLAEFQRTGIFRPITLDIGPTNKCNLNCPFCSVKNRDKSLELSLEQAKSCVSDYIGRGIKSVEITGDGEPTVWPHFADFVRWYGGFGRSLALITNGTQLHLFPSTLLGNFNWIRASLNGFVDFWKVPSFEVPDAVDLSFNYVWHGGSMWPETWDVLKKVLDAYPKALVLKIQLDINEQSPPRCFADLPGDPRVIVSIKHDNAVPGHCYMGYMKPHLCATGYIFPCSTCALPYGRYPEEFKIGEWNRLPSMTAVPFDNSNCTRCFAREQNEVVHLAGEGLKHGEFL